MMFQQTIATSKFTLPVVALFSLVAWFLCGDDVPSAAGMTAGGVGEELWSMIPEYITTGTLSVVFGFILSLVAVYLMTEFNNNFVLLRISSRMLGSVLALLLTVSSFLHPFQPAHVVLILMLLSYFPLFATYQRAGSMAYVFVSYLLLSIASLLFPKVLLLVPFYWMGQTVLRSLNLRTIAASVFGVVVPYWIVFAFAYISDCLPEVFDGFIGDFSFALPDYSVWDAHCWVLALLTFVLAVMGAVNFYMHDYLDKTRTRVYLNVVVLLAFASFLLLVWEPGHFAEVFPLVLINTSILAGHHLAQTYSRLTNIYTIVLCLMFVAFIVLDAVMYW